LTNVQLPEKAKTDNNCLEIRHVNKWKWHLLLIKTAKINKSDNTAKQHAMWS